MSIYMAHVIFKAHEEMTEKKFNELSAKFYELLNTNKPEEADRLIRSLSHAESERSVAKSFDLQLALNGRKVKTRDGRNVSHVTLVNNHAPKSAEDVNDSENYTQGIVATIHNTLGESRFKFYHDGGSHKYGGENGADLVMA